MHIVKRGCITWGLKELKRPAHRVDSNIENAMKPVVYGYGIANNTPANEHLRLASVGGPGGAPPPNLPGHPHLGCSAHQELS